MEAVGLAAAHIDGGKSWLISYHARSVAIQPNMSAKTTIMESISVSAARMKNVRLIGSTTRSLKTELTSA